MVNYGYFCSECGCLTEEKCVTIIQDKSEMWGVVEQEEEHYQFVSDCCEAGLLDTSGKKVNIDLEDYFEI